QLVQESVYRLFACGLEYEAEETAGAGEIPFPDLVSRVALEGGVHHALDFRTIFEPSRDAQARLVVAIKTNSERAQSSQREVHVVRANTQAHRVDRIFQRRQRRRVGRYAAEHDVRVAADVFGAGLD